MTHVSLVVGGGLQNRQKRGSNPRCVSTGPWSRGKDDGPLNRRRAFESRRAGNDAHAYGHAGHIDSLTRNRYRVRLS